MARGRLSRQLEPLRLGGFRLLFLSTLGSSLGTLLAAVALAIDVKDRTNSGIWVGAVLLVETIPTVVVGLTLGPLLDRLQRRRLMIAADLVRVAVFALLPFTTTPGQIVALALVAGLGNGFFRNAVYAGVPNLVPEDELPSANSLLQTVENVSWTIGPLLGGILTAAAGPNAAYWINAVSFLVSAVLVSRIPAVKLQSETALSKGHWTDLKDGFVAVFRSRMMLAVLFGWGIALFGSGAINVGEIFLAKNVLGAGDFGYGLLYGSMGLGLVIGSFWSAAIVDRVGVARAYGAALLVCSVGFGVGALSIGIWMAAACCVVGGFGNGVAIVCNVLLLQRGSTDEMRGRSFTFVMSVTHLLAGAGLLVAGALLPSQGARWLWGLGALTIGLGAIVGYTLAREPRGSAVPAAEA